MRESQELFLELRLSQRYTYKHYKIIKFVPKITQDKVTSDLNLSMELNGKIKVQETQVEWASIVIKGNMINMTLSNQVNNMSIMFKKDHAKIIDFEVNNYSWS